MVAITIRNIPDHVRDELTELAERSGHSLEEYLATELIDLAMRRTGSNGTGPRSPTTGPGRHVDRDAPPDEEGNRHGLWLS